MSEITCGGCGAPLSHINSVCDTCLPNFYSALPATEMEAKPVAWQWRAMEDGEPRTAWRDENLGDLPGWGALEKRSPEKYKIERRPLFSADTVAQLESERDEARAMVERLLEAGKQDLILMEKTGSTMVSLRQRTEAAEADNARLRADLGAEVERLRPHYQSQSASDVARRQMLDHFAKFAARTAMEDHHGE